MAILFDKVHNIMTVEEPDTEVTIQELLNAIREWEDELENLAEPKVCNAYGMQDLGGGVYVGITLELLNNWKVKFEGRTSSLDTGTITATDATGEHLIDSTAQFITDDLVYTGCTVFNANTADMAALLHIESEIMICSEPLSGGAGGGWTIGNTYVIYPNVQCTITGGNLTGLLSTPIAQSPNVQVVMEQSSSATLQVSGSGVTEQDKTDIIDGTWEKVIETLTAKEILRILLAVMAGKTSIADLGGGLATVKFRDVADTKDRVEASMDESERTSITLDGS